MELSKKHDGKVPPQEVRNLLKKSSLQQVMPGFLQKGWEALTKAKVVSAMKKTMMEKIFDPAVQLDAIQLHSEGKLFTDGSTEEDMIPDAFDEPPQVVCARCAPPCARARVVLSWGYMFECLYGQCLQYNLHNPPSPHIARVIAGG